MRRVLTALAALSLAAVLIPQSAEAQSNGRPGQGGQQSRDRAPDQGTSQDARRVRIAPLSRRANAGPCPYVKVLYDAGRYVEFKDGREASGSVAYTGEIQGISAGCQYKDDEPIKVTMEVLFELGRGPQAESSTKNYRYWVAVTKRNDAVIAKEYFDLPVTFAAGQDRLYAREKIGQVTIPRATQTTSGANFEILVGFDVTPEMAAFNRDGKRFRLNAGTAVAGNTNETK